MIVIEYIKTSCVNIVFFQTTGMTTRPYLFRNERGESVMEEQVGIVLTVQGNTAEVRASRHSHCESCGACPGAEAMTLMAWNTPGAKVGQKVVFLVYEVSMIKAAFVTFALPLLTTLAGIGVGYWVAQDITGWPVWGGALLGAALGIGYIRYFDRKLHNGKGSMSEIIRIIE